MQLPEIPDKIPIKKRKILGPIARLLLSKHDWSIVGKFPNRKKMILIGAPHTAHRDAWFGLLVVLALDLRVNFFGAKWMFSRLPSPITFSKNLDRLGMPWPLGWLQKYMLVRLGGIPVHREENKGIIESTTSKLKELDSFLLLLAPEGGIKHVEHFRSGFYYLAKNLNVPYVPVAIDYKNRQFKIHRFRKVSDSFEKDTQEIKNIFNGVEGYYRTFRA
jgi:hypothetical protein